MDLEANTEARAGGGYGDHAAEHGNEAASLNQASRGWRKEIYRDGSLLF